MTAAVLANETEIKRAMSALRLDSWTDDLLNEIELNRRLKHSLEQADRGELIPADEVKKEIGELFTNGHFDKR
ncbi:MAG: hypothetical protein LBH25_05145 [Fibromonadaceae bacterium]|jgi:predicted transcriptional regulator|nr:hypothetical protein [Fibromonadaceae bacterium]